MISQKIGIVSGYFNPLHKGHLEYINAAKDECDFLVAIVNNDLQVELKKSKKFMDENHRLEIVKNLKAVDFALVSVDKDGTVSKTLEVLGSFFKDHEVVFYNSGDRQPGSTNEIEDKTCDNLHINRKFLSLPKIYSSSDLKK